jgi:hypothetical protein
MKSMLRAGLWMALASLPLAACGSSESWGQDPLPRVEACFISGPDVFPVRLEVAGNNRQRQKGLMGREHLPENAGMVFEYRQDKPADHGFWMYRTLIPLDIAYMDEQGVIVSIHNMLPCTSARSADCPAYPSGVAFRNAVEMNADYFRKRDIKPGDRLVWPATERCDR